MQLILTTDNYKNLFKTIVTFTHTFEWMEVSLLPVKTSENQWKPLFTLNLIINSLLYNLNQLTVLLISLQINWITSETRFRWRICYVKQWTLNLYKYWLYWGHQNQIQKFHVILFQRLIMNFGVINTMIIFKFKLHFKITFQVN